MTDQALLNIALQAKEQAYAPYSKFCVGAALLCKDGTVYTGCNIENASYTPTICAERTAVFKAISEGKRRFIAMAVAGDATPCSPCGVCRQVLAEFCEPSFTVVLQGADGNPVRYTLAQLLPVKFTL